MAREQEGAGDPVAKRSTFKVGQMGLRSPRLSKAPFPVALLTIAESNIDIIQQLAAPNKT